MDVVTRTRATFAFVPSTRLERFYETRSRDGKPACAAAVHDSLGVGFHQCGAVGKVQAEGHWWCGVHSPEADARRKAASDAKAAAYRAKQDAHYATVRARQELLERAGAFKAALEEIAAGSNDPRAVAAKALGLPEPEETY